MTTLEARLKQAKSAAAPDQRYIDSLRRLILKDAEKDMAENPRKYELFSTAYSESLNAYCSIKKVNHEKRMFLVNFGYSDVWTPLEELSRFCL